MAVANWLLLKEGYTRRALNHACLTRPGPPDSFRELRAFSTVASPLHTRHAPIASNSSAKIMSGEAATGKLPVAASPDMIFALELDAIGARGGADFSLY
ncbi:hypothetical protein PsorP6_005123 [Peronosclerospora sorghi]|uniref:Uncharacterized protein n=1 Tax=Peronosclerospora sorghi TaxID=230839 RepID=A0ACC0W261_9STRA|nr:hypothetical protein PsorP6_005123 [Peronosclerospora sorghi]